jgi:hypothetical protein
MNYANDSKKDAFWPPFHDLESRHLSSTNFPRHNEYRIPVNATAVAVSYGINLISRLRSSPALDINWLVVMPKSTEASGG